MSPVVPTAPTPQEQSIPTGRFQPLVSLKKHRRLTIVVITLGVLVGLVAAILSPKPLFVARAILLVSPKFISNLKPDQDLQLANREYELFFDQQKHLISRVDLLQEALKSPFVQKYWLNPLSGKNKSKEENEKQKERANLELLQKALGVTGNGRKDAFMLVSLSGAQAQGLDKALNVIIELFLKKSKSESLYDSEGRIDSLKQKEVELLQLLPKLQSERAQVAEELGVTTFQENSLNPYDGILVESTSALIQARRQRAESEAKLNALNQLVQGKTVLDILTQDLVANDTALKTFKSRVIDKRTDLTTQILGLTPQHPGRQRAEQEIEKLNNDIAQATDNLFQDIRKRLLEQRQADLTQTQRVEQALISEVEAQRQQAIRYSTSYNKALNINKDIQRAYEQLDKIRDRIEFFKIESTAPGFVRLDTPAVEPLYPEGPGRKKVLLIFIVLSFGMGILLPIAIDLLNRRIQTPGEVQKILGFAPLAWILDCRDSRTEQVAIDSIRRLALALNRDRRTHQSHSFALTAVKPGGGSTTLTLELAFLLNQIGIKALAIELNPFAPDDRYYNDNPEALGLANLLSQDQVSLEDIHNKIQPATEILPPRLPIGITDKRHFHASTKLIPIFSQLHTLYDIILLDSPPILLSSDAELLGEIADGILLVIEARQITPGELKRAARLLEHLNPRVVATILNRVEVFEGGGYFNELIQEYSTGKKIKPSWFRRTFWS